MNPWNTYRSRINAHGITKRDSVLQRERAFLSAKLPASLSYHQLTVNGTVRNMAVINSDNLNLKTLCTMPGEDLPHGGLVEWMGNHWLITEKDANNELYTKGTMKQCNYLLRWIAEDDTVVERWCVIEDGTKYLTGEYGDNDFIVVRGDSRISLTLAKDEYSIQLNRNNRFLIDDYDSKNVLAYRLTKPFKLGGSYNGEGVLNFVLTECNTEDSDISRHRVFKRLPIMRLTRAIPSIAVSAIRTSHGTVVRTSTSTLSAVTLTPSGLKHALPKSIARGLWLLILIGISNQKLWTTSYG